MNIRDHIRALKAEALAMGETAHELEGRPSSDILYALASAKLKAVKALEAEEAAREERMKPNG